MNTSAQTKPSIIFCHGIWADGWGFSNVIPPLQAEGHELIAAQYGLDTNEGDVGRSELVRRHSHSKSNGPSGSLTKKENSHERAY
jgi:hypothetical protein